MEKRSLSVLIDVLVVLLAVYSLTVIIQVVAKSEDNVVQASLLFIVLYVVFSLVNRLRPIVSYIFDYLFPTPFKGVPT